METKARRFETIGTLTVSGAVSAQDVGALKAWLDLALKLKLTLVIDLNHADMDKKNGAALQQLLGKITKQGLHAFVVIQDETWKSPKSLAQAFELIGTQEARAIQQIITLENKFSEAGAKGAQNDENLEEILALYGKDRKTLEEMQPNELMKLHRKVADRLEYLLAVYADAIATFRSMVGRVSKQTVSEIGVGDLAETKREIVDYLKQKGIG